MVLSVLRVFIITLRKTILRACIWENQYKNLKDWLYSAVPTDAFFFFNHLSQYSFGISGQLLPYWYLTCFLKCLFRHFPSILSLQDVHNFKMRTFILLFCWLFLYELSHGFCWVKLKTSGSDEVAKQVKVLVTQAWSPQFNLWNPVKMEGENRQQLPSGLHISAVSSMLLLP